MSREAAKKIIDLMLRHGAEQNAVLAENTIHLRGR
jgi:hypothetical protein